MMKNIAGGAEVPTKGLQPSFAGGVIGPGLWGRVDLAKYDVALRVGKNIFIHNFGGFSNRAGFEFVAEVQDSSKVSRLIPFERDDETNYVLEFSDLEMRVIKNGAIVLEASGTTITGATQASPVVLTCTAHGWSDGDRIYVSGVGGMTELNGRTFTVSNATTNTVELTDIWGVDVNGVGFSAFTSGGTATRELVVVTPFAAADVGDLDFAQSADVMYLAHRNYAPKKLSRTSETSWTFTDVAVDPTNVAPTTGLTVTPGGAGAETYNYRVSSITADGTESFPSAVITNAACQDLTVSGAENTIAWDAATGADEYNIYRERNGVYGFIGFTDATSFVDDNISPTLTTTPVEAANLFGSSGEYPGAVTLIQQRLVFGGSENSPETIWMSRVGDFENFTKSRVLTASDRVEVGLSGRSVNSVRHLMGLRELLAFAARGEFTITGAQGFISPIEPVVTQYGYTGALRVKPLVVNDTALFVERSGDVIRDLRYVFEQDGYTGNELSILAYHFFQGKSVADWSYAQSPFSIVWTVMSDGTLLSMTYKREHQVWAWTEHDLGDGVVAESTASVPEGTEDAVYVIVKKTINSQEKRYILRLHSREFDSAEDCFFVDFGLTYSGASVSTVTNLNHLEGEAVVALVDGNVVKGLTVSMGSVTLPRAGTKIHVGIGYDADAETLPPAVDLQGYGTSRGRPHKANSVSLQLEDSRGIKVGPTSSKLTEQIQTGGDLSSAIGLFTGLTDFDLSDDWNTDGTIFVRQDNPLPMTVLAIAPELTIGR